MRSRPAKALTSISSVERGRWKLVSRPSTIAELIAGHDEKVGPAFRRAGRRPAFQGACDGRADSHDPSAGGADFGHLLHHRGRHGVPLAMHAMLARIVVGDGSKRVQADVEDQRRPADAAGGEPVEQVAGEVQAGRRRRGRAERIGEDGLIALGVAEPAADVRRQRDGTSGEQRRIRLDLDVPDAIVERRRHAHNQVGADRDDVAGPQAAGRASQRFPLSRPARAQQQKLGPAAAESRPRMRAGRTRERFAMGIRRAAADSANPKRGRCLKIMPALVGGARHSAASAAE